MADTTQDTTNAVRTESPDPSSHTVNIYDATGTESEWVDDGDDMDFEPAADDSEDNEYFDPREDVEVEFHDAEDGLSGIEIQLSIDEVETELLEDEGENDTEMGERQEQTAATPVTVTAARPIHVSHTQIMQLLGHAGLRRIFTNHRGANSGGAHADDDDDDVAEFYDHFGLRRRRRPNADPARFPTVPSEEGRKLMDNGTFGSNESYEDVSRKRKPNITRMLMNRELGVDGNHSTRTNKLISQGLIPSSNADTIIHYDDKCYSGQFSDDGNFFFSCAQDFKVRMYDTSNPYKWKYYKTVVCPIGQWTITDASLSPDNKYLAYSSIRSIVCLAPTDPGQSGDPWLLDFSDMSGRGSRSRLGAGYSHFGVRIAEWENPKLQKLIRLQIWSLRFSGDGREIVAGTSDNSVYVYDIESRQSILRIPGHSDDVNAVCFGDASSPHILYSGSDDTLIKVWDRRSMSDNREAGVFMGHTEGLTYVDSKGDGRYVLSNGKDQMMKLWDLRKMMPTEKASKVDPGRYTIPGYDYRFMAYDENNYKPHPHDCSLVTFRGHRVLKTLIRCHFSPPGSTNSRYVYSGSEDGGVYIYNMDATLAGKIDVNAATHHSRPRDSDLDASTYGMDDRSSGSWKTCVRDASWHPNAPVIAATSWNGWGQSTGTCTTHSWNDGAEDDEAEPRMGLRVDERLNHDEKLCNNPRLRSARTSQFRRGLRSQRVAAANENGDEEPW